MPQKFKRKDLVQIATDLGPSMSHFPKGCRAIVMGSYYDQHAGGDEDDTDDNRGADGGPNGHQYTLWVEGRGGHSWYNENQLELIRHGAGDLLQEWKRAMREKDAEEEDLEYIVAHWNEFSDKKSWPGATCGALMKMIGITNPWGSRGEGIVWHVNATATVQLLDAAMKTGDIEAVRARIASIKSGAGGQ